MEFTQKGPYHHKSECGYTISMAQVDKKWLLVAWPPNYTTNTPALGVTTSKTKAINLCIEHKNQNRSTRK